jgi:TolB-like protein/Tfp pilus assembly protein PilF
LAFLAELKRRNVIRMAGLYLVGAWLITQVAATLLPVFEAPIWAMKTIIAILAFGFIPSLIFAWIFELTPEGLKRDAEVMPEHSIAPQTGRRMERIIIVLFAIALSFFSFDKFVLAPQREAAAVTAMATRVKAETIASIKNAAVEKSIAVLPFVNMSADKDNEYFSDGISEEILNALTKVDDLKVTGRTSSFYFKGKNENLTKIGDTLGVAHVLEGSVRKQGQKVRITAQLVRTLDGFRLWSETYDGDLKDVFALQEKIARSITDALKIVLIGHQSNRLVNAGTSNTEAYELYLQASAIFNRRDGARFEEAIDLLNKAIKLDPGYARAHARLAALYVINGNFSGSAAFSSALAKVEQEARLASALDPTLAEPYAALALALNERRHFVEARIAMEQASKLDPNDVTTAFWRGAQLINTGYLREGNAALDHALKLDPLMPNALLWRGRNYVFDNDLANGERLLQRAAEVGHTFVGIGQSRLDMARGNKVAAVASLTRAMTLYFSHDFPPDSPAIFARAVYGDIEAKKQSQTMINDYLATKPEYITGAVPFVLILSGDANRGLTLVQDKPTSNDGAFFSELFHRQSPIAGASAFPEFARRSGLADLWDRFGTPDHCKKNVKGDYVCE